MNNREWFHSARFGMMIHWGLYALLAGEYDGKQMGGADNGSGELAEWAQSFFRIPKAKYDQLTKAFNPVAFDADQWVKLAKDAGMQYLVITSKHHEGFALFQSETDPYNVADATPFHRDVIGELAEACRRHGLKLGLYYSQELDWHEPDGGGYGRENKSCGSSWTNDWDFPDASQKDFSRCFERKIKPQVKEILTKYGDICLIWFDTPYVISPAQSRELFDLVKSLQPDCLVNSRIGNGMGDYVSLGDNQVPAGKKEAGALYETAATLNDTWGYKAYDQNWKKPEQVISLLTRLASRNVNYLLNVGPDPLGRIPAAAQDVLKQVGEWVKINGDMIFGAESSPYAVELPVGPVTRSGSHLYILLEHCSGELAVPGLLTRIVRAEIPGVGEVEWTQEGNVLRAKLPDLTGVLCPVLKLTADEPVRVKDGILQMPDGSLRLSPVNATLTGGVTVSRASDTEGWTDEKGCLEWTFDAEIPGTFAVELTVNGLHGIEPCECDAILTVNGASRPAPVRRARDIDPLIARHHKGMYSDLGTVELRPGENRISLRLACSVERDQFRLAELRLTRV